jgi:hypothetical protein
MSDMVRAGGGPSRMDLHTVGEIVIATKEGECKRITGIIKEQKCPQNLSDEAQIGWQTARNTFLEEIQKTK